METATLKKIGTNHKEKVKGLSMNRREVIEIDTALGKSANLKAKHLSNTSFTALLWFKRNMESYKKDMSENELECAKAFGAEITQAGISPPKDEAEAKAFWEKVNEVHKANFHPKELNFIPLEEFRNWTEDSDTGVSLTLAQYLMQE